MVLDIKKIEYSKELSGGILMTSQHTAEDREYVCESLIAHNVEHTSGLLGKPGIDINLYLKDGPAVIGAILCMTYNMCLYIDVLWLEKSYRGKGYGSALIEQAEKIAKEHGCIFSHTNTSSFQSPEFYKACGYEVFGELGDFPDGIVTYFLKKTL